METNKKIIGYRCPVDIHGGKVKKGTIYTKIDNDWFGHNNTTGWYLPKEIVETWEPVYEDTVITVDGYKAELSYKGLNGAKVKFECKEITIDELRAIKMLMELSKKHGKYFEIDSNGIHYLGDIEKQLTPIQIDKLIKDLS